VTQRGGFWGILCPDHPGRAMVGPGVGCCSSCQHDGGLVFPSSMGWCLMQAHPTPLCLCTSGIQTRRTTPVWSARPCPATSRVSIPLPRAWCCPVCLCGGWDELASLFGSVHHWWHGGKPCVQAEWSLTPHWLHSVVGRPSAPCSAHVLGGTEAPWCCSGFSFLHLGLPPAA